MCKRLLCIALVAACLSSAASAADKLKITDIKIGKGHKAAAGDLVTVLYEGTLVNGTVFDSNFKKDANPFAFVLGAGSVIKGWDQGVVGMATGGVRKLRIPPELGYGRAEQKSIPAYSTLIFMVKVLDIVKKGDEAFYDKAVLKTGKGKVARQGSSVTIHYVGTLLNGKQFDARDVTFTIGTKEALKAIDMAVTGMREGGEIRLRLPPSIAFGVRGVGETVPPNSVVVFDITLRKVGQKKR
jgi:FKBP-type peptidyl-prolyl cis-trans isomerase